MPKFQLIDAINEPGDAASEDRAGVAGALAWIVDGATDVIEAPLTTAASDSLWFADAVDRALRHFADADVVPSLRELPALIAADVEPAFLAAARRPPAGRGEHPSASGLFVRAGAEAIEFLSVGDCALVVAATRDDANGVVSVGIGETSSGDRWVADMLRREGLTRAELWPRLRAVRARMNTEGGYGVLSITAPPASCVRHGHIAIDGPATLLLATDGLARLVDVFGLYTPASLIDAARDRGLAALVAELRAVEAADADCRRFPRAKARDDAAALLLELENS